MLVRIYIPTRGRVGLNRQVSLREFQQFSSHRPILVCPPSEAREHKRYWPLVRACPAKGIGPTRQWILENSAADVVVMIDDDMRFSYRPDPKIVQLEKCTELDPLVSLITECVAKGFIHGGVGARQGNNRKDLSRRRQGFVEDGHLFVDCERSNNFHFASKKDVLALGARMDALPVMEDFHFTLFLITKGYPNRIIHDYVWNQEGSGAQGGCSIYRTPEVQSQGANGLKRAFPEFVRVVTKTSKDTSPAWREFKTREDVVIQWVKAARAGGIDV